MSDVSVLDEVIVLTIGSAWLNQMELSPDVWHVVCHDVYFTPRHIADVLIWHEKYPDDAKLTSSDRIAALFFLSRLESIHSKSAVMYVHEVCAGDQLLAAKCSV